MPTGKTLLYVNESSLDRSNFYLSKLTTSIGLLAKAKKKNRPLSPAQMFRPPIKGRPA